MFRKLAGDVADVNQAADEVAEDKGPHGHPEKAHAGERRFVPELEEVLQIQSWCVRAYPHANC